MSTINAPQTSIGGLMDVGRSVDKSKRALTEEKLRLENQLANFDSDLISNEESKNHLASQRLRYIMLSYVASTNAFHAVLKKMAPNMSDSEFKKAMETAEIDILNNYSSDGLALSNKLKEYGVSMSAYIGSSPDYNVAEHIEATISKLSFKQRNDLNTVLTPLIDIAIKDPNYDVGLPREELTSNNKMRR